MSIGFISIIFFSTLIGVIALSNMSKIQKNGQSIYDERIIPILVVSKVQVLIEQDRNNYQNILLNENKAPVYLEKIKKNLEENKTLLKTYEGINKSEEAKDAFLVFQRSYESYTNIFNNVEKMVIENKLDLVNNEISNIDINNKAMSEYLDTLINIHKDEANNQNKLNKAIFQSSFKSILFFIILVIIISFFVSFLIVKILNYSLNKLRITAEALAKGDINVDLVRIESNDEIGELFKAFASMIENIKGHTGVAKEIAEGNFEVDIEVRSERDILGIELSNMVNTIKTINEEIKNIIENVENGDLGKRLDTIYYKGGWRDHADGINTLVHTLVKPINITSDYMEMISRGNIPDKISDTFNGDFNSIKDSINTCIDVLNGIIGETNTLIEAVENGDLSIRGDEEIYNGKWKSLIGGINKLTDTFVEPISFTEEFLSKLGKGINPGEAKKEYKGDFEKITNSLNDVLNSFEELFNGTAKLTGEAKEGNLKYRADITKLPGSYGIIAMGINDALEQVVIPLEEISRVLGETALGNLDVVISGEYKGDYAKVKESVNNTLVSLKYIIKEISYVLGELAVGNLNVSIERDYKGSFKEISDSINLIIKSLNSTMYEIDKSSNEVATGSRQVSDSSINLSQGASLQASSIEEITTAITEIAAQTKESASNANKANKVSVSVKLNADAGKKDMVQMLKAMDDISISSGNIKKIIKVIDDIAFQTNILALNAAVEAARVGSQGRGFAVVANEFRNLASRTAEAAKDTANLIEESIDKSNIGKKIAESTSKSLFTIAEQVEEVTDLFQSISESSKEQAIGISNINQAIEEVAKITQANTATAEERAAASEELLNQAELLKERVSKFKLSNSSS